MIDKRCVILVAHGSSRASWRKPLEALQADLMLRMPDVEMRLAYLELCEPLFENELAHAMKGDYGVVSVLPLFRSCHSRLTTALVRVCRTAPWSDP